MANPRAEKVAKRIQQIVAMMLRGQVKDPRVEPVTVTDVKVTGDLQQATVFYTVLGDRYEADDAARGLKAATGLVRREVGHQLGLRLTPTIQFTLDQLPEAARSFEDVLTAAKARDAELAARRGTEFAGDPDPYRRPRSQEESAGDASESGATSPAAPVSEADRGGEDA